MSFRFGAVISHPIQHYSPVFRDLARVPGMEVKVFYACDHGVADSYDPGFDTRFAWDVDLVGGYDHMFLRPGFSPRRFGFWEVDSPRLQDELDRFSPHALWVHGYGQRLCWRALDWARDRAAIIYFGDSELVHARALHTRLVKEPIVRYFFRRCDAFITIGDNNERYYRHYGVPDERLHRGACPVDVNRFLERSRAASADGRDEVRRRLGFSPDTVVVAALGKLEPRKRPFDLLDAIARVRGEGLDAGGLFIGDGPLAGPLEQRIAGAGLADAVRVSGFVNQRAIPDMLQAADVLAVMSDLDPHPLAVTEALTAGLPIIASDRIGCVGETDTARPDVNTLVYPCGDSGELAGAIRRLISSPALRDRLGEASLAIAPTQDVSVTVRTVVEIIAALRPKFDAVWRDVARPTFDELERFLEGPGESPSGRRCETHTKEDLPCAT